MGPSWDLPTDFFLHVPTEVRHQNCEKYREVLVKSSNYTNMFKLFVET